MANTIQNSMEALRRARQLAQAGDLAGAAELCRAVLARDPAQFHALFMLGNIESGLGNFAAAEPVLAKAASINPRSPEAQMSLGSVLLELKKDAAAADAFSKALALQPGNADALVFRGLAYAQDKKQDAALADFDRAIALAPGSVPALHNRVNLLIEMARWKDAMAGVQALLRIAPANTGALANYASLLIHEKRTPEAMAALDRALAIEPASAELWNLRGYALSRAERPADALSAYERALMLDPRHAGATLGRANMLFELKRYDEATAGFDAAIALQPGNAAAYVARANASMEREQLSEALGDCDIALRLKPDFANAWLLRGNILLHTDRYDEAIASYDNAVAAAPEDADAHYHRGSSLLLGGNFAAGWRDFEWRWQSSACTFERPHIKAPEWKGENLSGRRIAIYSEQGLGDTIQFARYVPILAKQCAKLTFLCHPTLLRLFRALAPGVELIASCDPDRTFDYQCALMSVPHWMGTALATIPGEAPYLMPERDLVERWREKLGSNGFRIGIGWQGNPLSKVDRGRSPPLKEFAALAIVPGVRLISLQKIDGVEQLTQVPAGMAVETLGPDVDPAPDAFIDTAAIMQNMDLIVTSDTALAHLAGALGLPVWVPLKHIPDWRFMLERDDSPWYPSMRLFRQKSAGDWAPVFADIAGALQKLIGVSAFPFPKARGG